MIDDEVYRRAIVQLVRKIADLEATIQAIGQVLIARDPDVEADLGRQRAAALERAAPGLALFERAEAADLLAMLKAFSRPPH